MDNAALLTSEFGTPPAEPGGRLVAPRLRS